MRYEVRRAESTSRCSPLWVVTVEEWGFVFRLERGVLVFTKVFTTTYYTPIVKGLLPCSVKVTNAWICASSSPYAFIECTGTSLRFTAMCMKSAVAWDVTPCNLASSHLFIFLPNWCWRIYMKTEIDSDVEMGSLYSTICCHVVIVLYNMLSLIVAPNCNWNYVFG